MTTSPRTTKRPAPHRSRHPQASRDPADVSRDGLSLSSAARHPRPPVRPLEDRLPDHREARRRSPRRVPRCARHGSLPGIAGIASTVAFSGAWAVGVCGLILASHRRAFVRRRAGMSTSSVRPKAAQGVWPDRRPEWSCWDDDRSASGLLAVSVRGEAVQGVEQNAISRLRLRHLSSRSRLVSSQFVGD